MTDVYILANRMKDYQLGYLAAVLNSTLLNAFHRTFCKVKRAGYLEYSGDAISDLPIRRIEFATPIVERQQQPRRIVSQYEIALEKLLKEREKTADVVIYDAFAGLLGTMGGLGDTVHIPLDVLHDFLAYLAEEMIELNKKKRDEIVRFVGWLGRSLRLVADKTGDKTIESLTGKAGLKDYLGDYEKGEGERPFELIVDVLRKNANRLGVPLNDSRLVGHLREEYVRSLVVLLPIKRRLAVTD